MSSLPFEVRVLEPEPHSSNPSEKHLNLSTLLPATTRIKDDIVAPEPNPQFLEKELLVKRLNDVHDWLWICGRPMPPRPLHHQQLLSRKVTISEDPELHLVWYRDRIFIKPLPSYLLDPEFWRAYLVSDPRLDACARGFLFSYAALIAYKTDFRLARESGLLPDELTWDGWKTLTAELLRNHSYESVNSRYWYGELRLSRLNKIYCFRKGYLLRGYSRVASYAFYADLLRENFSILIGILGYVAVALGAMQVGLGVDRLVGNSSFQNASYGLTVFSLIAPLIGAVLIFFFVFIMIISNYMETKAYEKRRFKGMQVHSC